MSTDSALVPVPLSPGVPAPAFSRGAALPEPAAPPSALHQLHRLLRGRYRWALVLGLSAAVLAAAGGWFSTQPIWRSTGQVRIRPILPRVLGTGNHDQEQDSVMFDEYVDYQTSLLTTRRVVVMALASLPWQGLGPPHASRPLALFVDGLEATRPNHGQLIEVTYKDRDPLVAVAAVKAVVGAYQAVFSELENQGQTDRLPLLQARRAELTGKLDALREHVLSIAREFGPDGLAQMHTFKLTELNKLEARLRDIEVALATHQAHQSVAASAGPSDLSVEQLALQDTLLREYLHQKGALETELAGLRQRYGENHRQVAALREQLDVLKDQIQRYMQRIGSRVIAGQVPGSITADPLLTLSPDELQAQEAKIRQLFNKLQAETSTLGQQHQEIERVKIEMTSIQTMLDETKQRIDELKLQAEVKGRIEVISAGDVPVRPFKDQRALRAIAGFGGGGMVGVGAVALLGLVYPTLRHSADARQSALGRVRLLGILPTLSTDVNDTAQSTEAAYCIHQIRTFLQLGAGGAPGACAITSAAPGSGKTSLTLALGMSFAASGSRTLLIDGDLEGRGLTARVGAMPRKPLGQILCAQGLLTTPQLEPALQQAQESGRLLGEVLVELGLIADDQLREALDFQETTCLGLLQALAGEPWRHCVADTGLANLTILPVARGQEDRSGLVAPATMHRLLADIRGQFDIILIDTGPIGGSVESAIFTTEADQTVLVVSRGDQRPMVEEALGLLDSVGARLAGLVFNRADARDFSRSVSARSVHIRPAVGRGPGRRRARYGPVGDAIARRSGLQPDEA